MLRLLPRSVHPDLLVGFETNDDAGVFRLSDHLALVQTVDFFTPIVDDPYSYGAIAAANSLSDIYAMGGKPLTAMNICCFDPSMAPAEVWSAIFQGAYDKTVESGAVLVGGHSVEDKEPKFGLSVTGTVDPESMFSNDRAEPGDWIVLTKPLGTGIVTTAGKFEECNESELKAAIDSMSILNKEASEYGLSQNVRCATDITGFGLAGHLFNVARSSAINIELYWDALPLLPGLDHMVQANMVTAGARRNESHLGDRIEFDSGVNKTAVEVIFDPQTSGGLALYTKDPTGPYQVIGRVLGRGEAKIKVRSSHADG